MNDSYFTTVRPEPVEGPFVLLGTGFDRLSPNGKVLCLPKTTSVVVARIDGCLCRADHR